MNIGNGKKVYPHVGVTHNSQLSTRNLLYEERIFDNSLAIAEAQQIKSTT